MVLARVADLLEMLNVFAVLEATIMGKLRPEVCAEVLMNSRWLGLRQVEEEAWAALLACQVGGLPERRSGIAKPGQICRACKQSRVYTNLLW